MLKRAFPLVLGRRKGRVLMLQSDDWGSIRTPSKQVWETLQAASDVDVDDPYSKYDTLASAQDLEALFEVLNSVKDQNGHPAVLTANVIMGNPDFEKIKESKFQTYHYESFTQTLERYGQKSALQLWQQGRDQGVFAPQYHGREHVNVPAWLEKLREGHGGVLRAFERGTFAAKFSGLGLRKDNFQAAWDARTQEEEAYMVEAALEGYEAFERYFGFKSATAIPPSYTWTPSVEQGLRNKGVRAMQTIISHKEPQPGQAAYKRKAHLLYSNRYQVRTGFFEPSYSAQKDAVGPALRRIEADFKHGRPAILCTHRLNFIGGLVEQNRTRSLEQLERLLREVVKRWPDVAFVSAQDWAMQSK